MLHVRQAELRGEPEPLAAQAAGDAGARDLGEWPEAGDQAPAYAEEDAGQVVPR